MDTLEKTATSVEDFLKQALSNVYVLTSIKVFLVLYSAMAAPALPKSIAEIFNNTFFRILIAAIIVYMSTHDPTIAILVAVGFIRSLQTLNKYNMEKIINIEPPRQYVQQPNAFANNNSIIQSQAFAQKNVEQDNSIQHPVSPEEIAHSASPYFNSIHIEDKSHPASSMMSDHFTGSEEHVQTEEESPVASFTSPQQFKDAQDNMLLSAPNNKGITTFTNQISAQGDGSTEIGPYDKADYSAHF